MIFRGEISLPPLAFQISFGLETLRLSSLCFFKYKFYLPTGPLQGISETASAAEAKRKKINKLKQTYYYYCY